MKIPDFFATHQQKIIVASSILVSFVSGYSLCAVAYFKSGAEHVNNTPIQNYQQSSLAKPDPNCLVKGKINSKGILTYHLPGQSFYSTMTDVKCFDSEDEAQAAGYTKATR